ncbi:MAG TPA: BtrH N-terminal domain-containing protein [Acidimicrobiia bacterium]|nr:BtrH N-terminal domain-containing protein [Acidimicrobiia bacterium]
MTAHKKLKERIRVRMDKTGESYMTARRHVVGGEEHVADVGVHPDTSALARILADAGVQGPDGPLSEAIVLGIGGGLGAGYILWEFAPETDHKPADDARGDRRVVVIGFRNRWQYPDRWADAVLDRLGVGFRREHTTSVAKARRQLDEAVGVGHSVMVEISAADLPYWHLPAEEAGTWGYPIALVGSDPDRYLVDDRNSSRLTVASDAMETARARIPSYKNRMVVIDQSTVMTTDRLSGAIEAGLADAVEHLASRSDSFSLPAFRKWARMVTSDTGKGWKRVFADRRSLWRALRSTHDSVSDIGIIGGSLRPLYAEFLDEAARVLGRSELSAVAEHYRNAGEAWDDVADATLPDGFEPLREAVELSRRRREAVRRGDAGGMEAAEAAKALNELADRFEPRLPLSDSEIDDVLESLSGAIDAAYMAEVGAHSALSEVMRG